MTSEALGAKATPRWSPFDCGECGMLIESPLFHPYWHCVLFKGGVDPRHLDPPDPRLEAAEQRLREAERLLWALLDRVGREQQVVKDAARAFLRSASEEGTP